MSAAISQLACFTSLRHHSHLQFDRRSTLLRPKVGVNGPIEPILTENNGAAKIDDFCFGIPSSGFVLAAGLIGFIFSSNPATLTTNVLFGCSLLALSTTSLTVWRKGKSCLPFILDKAAMLCFYSYVLLAGGNPPPKKPKFEANYAS